MKNAKGFALLQALFFMMFIMAIVAITMSMSSQRNVSSSGQSMATDAYAVANNFLSAVIHSSTGQAGPSYSAGQYFLDHPLSPDYITQLGNEGFSDPRVEGNLVITVD